MGTESQGAAQEESKNQTLAEQMYPTKHAHDMQHLT